MASAKTNAAKLVLVILSIIVAGYFIYKCDVIKDDLCNARLEKAEKDKIDIGLGYTPPPKDLNPKQGEKK